MPDIEQLRKQYHAAMCADAIYLKGGDLPSMADVGSNLSIAISKNLMARLPYPINDKKVTGQEAGARLERHTRKFLETAFLPLEHLRPGEWKFSLHDRISDFHQYSHLSDLAEIIDRNRTLKTMLGDYFIAPDIVVARAPVDDSEIDRGQILSANPILPEFTPLRASLGSRPTLHASISCKWTIRSDRSQNARTEALNLIRNRKGHTPHIAVVTGEPMPTRIASIALGTGDIDCVYHFALQELVDAVRETGDEAAVESLIMMIDGCRLRDISDLPFDLAL
jgi:hypothetical protein